MGRKRGGVVPAGETVSPYYQDELVTLYHGDCLEVLPALADRVGALVTDPPYTAAGSSTNGRSSDADGQFFRFWMSAVFDRIRALMGPDTAGFVFADWRTLGDIVAAARTPGDRLNVGGAAWGISQALVWDREAIGMGSPFRNSFEMIAFAKGPDWEPSFQRNIPTVIRHRWPYTSREHGAEKPVALLVKLIMWAAPTNRAVLDPFAGSGSTLVAAKQIGARSIGVEIDERCCEIAARRLSQGCLVEVFTHEL